MTKARAHGLLLALLSTLAYACGPVYDTVYSFTPPETTYGRECVDTCKDSQSDCESYENEKQSDCEEREKDRMDRCAARIQEKEHRGPKITECGHTTSCTADLSKCETRYRTCYQACGGKVTSKQECVAFCGN